MNQSVSSAVLSSEKARFIPATEPFGGAHKVFCPHPDLNNWTIKAKARGDIYSPLSEVCDSCRKCNLPKAGNA